MAKKKSAKRARTSNKYCPKCKFKVRGPNHEEGEHHKSGGTKKKYGRKRRR